MNYVSFSNKFADYCSTHSECSPYGECAYDQTELRYACKCREGFIGDGKDCKARGDVGCDVLQNCHSNGSCIWSAKLSKYACECKLGYRGNGLMCEEDILGFLYT